MRSTGPSTRPPRSPLRSAAIAGLVLGLAAGAGAAHADPEKPAASAAAWCESNPGERRTIRGASWFLTDDEARTDRVEHRIAWRGRIDRDRRQDVIVDEGGCGSRECLHAAYVRCPDGSYSRVWGPEYAARVRVKRGARGWAVISSENVGDPDPDGRVERFWNAVRFGVGGYRRPD